MVKASPSNVGDVDLIPDQGAGIKGASQVALIVKNPAASAGDIRDVGSIPGLGRSPGGGHGNSLHCSCLENPHGQRSLEVYSS